MRLLYRLTAREDLDSIYDVIAPDNPTRALGFVEQIRAQCLILRDFPELGRERTDLGSGIRILPMLGRVVVAYRILPGVVEVVRVFYGGQDYEALYLD